MLCLLLSYTLLSQVELRENKSWCNLNCEYTKQDRATADLLHLRMKNDSIMKLVNEDGIISFPIRFGIVQNQTSEISQSELILRTVIENLNHSFREANFLFYLESVDIIHSDLYLEDLSHNQFNIYDSFSAENDKEDMLTIYVLDHKSEFCVETTRSVSCGRTGGFSYILSDRTNNVVVSEFDLLDSKIVAHEVAHFFGLYHTFEEQLFGKDRFDPEVCDITGDRVCDTPPDPGTVYEIYANYTTCEMAGYRDARGHEYKPLLENYMSYYKPCYLKEYSFTPGQILVMKVASTLPIRSVLSR